MVIVKDFLDELDQVIDEPMEVMEDTADEHLPIPVEDSLRAFKPIEQKIIEYTIAGDSADTIALKTALPVSTVHQLRSRSDIKDYIVLLRDSIQENELARLQGLYGKMIDARVDSVDDLADLSRKDTLDMMKAYQDLLLASKKLQKPEAEGNIFVNILQQVM